MAAFEGSPREKSQPQMLTRWLIASGVGIFVFLLSLIVAWQNTRPDFSFEQKITRHNLRNIDRALREQQMTNHQPRSAEQIRAELGDCFDGWHRPLIFAEQGTNVVAISYGRDGKPGGMGLDCDISSLDRQPQDSLPTLRQFYLDLPTANVVAGCLLSAAFACSVSLLTVKRVDMTAHGVTGTAFKLLITAAAALAVAMIISALHIPSGH